MAAARGLRGTRRLSSHFGSVICLCQAIICPEMTHVGTATKAEMPGTGIGNTSGIEKTGRDAPKDEVPRDSEIFRTVNERSVLSLRRLRRISDVRIGGAVRARAVFVFRRFRKGVALKTFAGFARRATPCNDIGIAS